MKAAIGAGRWLETEGSEGRLREAGRPRPSPGQALLVSKPVGRAGVRAPIVAMKPGNAGGAKGCRKMETQCPNFAGPSPAANAREGYTSRRDHEASLPHQEWSWIEPRIWTERMLAASYRGSTAARGAKWPRAPSLPNLGFSACPPPLFRSASPLVGEPSTGEPDAGDPHVRFGGRGCRIQSTLPTPIIAGMDPGRSLSSGRAQRGPGGRDGHGEQRVHACERSARRPIGEVGLSIDAPNRWSDLSCPC